MCYLIKQCNRLARHIWPVDEEDVGGWHLSETMTQMSAWIVAVLLDSRISGDKKRGAAAGKFNRLRRPGFVDRWAAMACRKRMSIEVPVGPGTRGTFSSGRGK